MELSKTSVAIWGTGGRAIPAHGSTPCSAMACSSCAQHAAVRPAQGPTAHTNIKCYFFQVIKGGFTLINKNAFPFKKHGYGGTIIPSTSLMLSQHFDKQPPHLCILKERAQLSSRRTQARCWPAETWLPSSWHGGPSSPLVPCSGWPCSPRRCTSAHTAARGCVLLCLPWAADSSRASAQPCWVLREFHKRFGQGVCGIVSKCRTKRIERIICCQNVLTDI